MLRTRSYRVALGQPLSLVRALYVRERLGLVTDVDVPSTSPPVSASSQRPSDASQLAVEWSSWWAALLASEVEGEASPRDPLCGDLVEHVRSHGPDAARWARARRDELTALDLHRRVHVLPEELRQANPSLTWDDVRLLVLPVRGLWTQGVAVGCVLVSLEAVLDEGRYRALLETLAR